MSKIILLRGEYGGVESEESVQLDVETFEKIKKGFEQLFAVVHVERSMMNNGLRMARNSKIKMEWRELDYFYLLSPEFDFEEKAAKMGRTSGGVFRKYVAEMPKFSSFIREKGLPPISIATVKAYLKNKEYQTVVSRLIKKNDKWIWFCKKCGLYHDAASYDVDKGCDSCADKLERYDADGRVFNLYTKQPKAKYEIAAQELLKRWPYNKKRYAKWQLEGGE